MAPPAPPLRRPCTQESECIDYRDLSLLSLQEKVCEVYRHMLPNQVQPEVYRVTSLVSFIQRWNTLTLIIFLLEGDEENSNDLFESFLENVRSVYR